jgi:hypothetical protein
MMKIVLHGRKVVGGRAEGEALVTREAIPGWGGVNPVQTPQTGVRITIPAWTKGQAFFLPFLGEVQKLEGVEDSGRISYSLPPISKGAVFWYEQ